MKRWSMRQDIAKSKLEGTRLAAETQTNPQRIGTTYL